MEGTRGEGGRKDETQTAVALNDDDNGDIKAQILLFPIQHKQQQFETWNICHAQGAASIGARDSANGWVELETQGKRHPSLSSLRTVSSLSSTETLSPVSQAHGSAPLHRNTDMQSIKPHCFFACTHWY